MQKKIALVLGGGGARGIAHLGVIKELLKHGIEIDFIIGVSMGALTGSYFALNSEVDSAISSIESFKSKKKILFDIVDIAIFKNSILKGKKAKQFYHSLIGDRNFSDVKIPIHIIATDLSSGEEVVISKGNLLEAIQASTCVPGIFPPVKKGNRYLIDGGVVNPTPVDIAKRLGADKIIAVDLITKNTSTLKKPTLITTLMQAYEIIRNNSVKYRLFENDKNVIILKPEIRGAIDSFKFYDIEKFVRAGEREVKKQIDKILKMLK